MLDIRLLRNNLDLVAANLAKRGFKLDKQAFSQLEEVRKTLQVKTQELQQERNNLAKEVGKFKSEGKEPADLLIKAGVIADKVTEIEAKLDIILTQQNEFVSALPNLLADAVPEGKSEEDNIVVREIGRMPQFSFTPKDHLALGEQLAGISASSGVKLSGSRFVVLQGAIAKLHRILAQFMLDVHTKEYGYQETYVPYIVNADSLFGTGQLPKFAQDLFKLTDDRNFYLIPTAEVPLTNLMRNEIIDEHALPLKFVAHSPCFRSEVGSYGKDLSGMFRVHQFDKVELVQIVHPDKSYQVLEEMTQHAESILQKLELPYRVMALCSADIGAGSCKTYDLEVWLPGQNRYREISSCSNTETFQARRMLARFRNSETNKPEFVHTLNGSGLAVGRTLIAVLENYQDKDGNIRIPKVLQPYMDGKEFLA